MSQAQTDPNEWRELLQEMSDLAIADPEIRDRLTPEQIKKRWLGEPPASNSAIAAAEQRLGVRLPPSYRAFLEVTSGWHFPNSFVVRLAGPSQIGWTREMEPELVSTWRQGSDQAAADYSKPPAGPEDYMSETLMINAPHEDDDGANFMLNPKTRVGEEMEAWFFSSWNPGASAYPSFWHLMVAQRDQLRAMQDAQQSADLLSRAANLFGQ